MNIGELAKRAHCSTQTIRYYEKEQLLDKPARHANNYRRYTQHHLQRLRFIRNCRFLDLNHQEIRALLQLIELSPSQCDAVNHVIDEHLLHVRTRLQQLQRLEHDLLHLHKICQRKCQKNEPMCTILSSLFELDYETEQSPSMHHSPHYSHD